MSKFEPTADGDKQVLNTNVKNLQNVRSVPHTERRKEYEARQGRQ